ncbi:MAG: hypothetical protein VX764_08350 [Planctomycetota bacterium]|nr:hypothetical protein [Planctomycetota bacterium]
MRNDSERVSDADLKQVAGGAGKKQALYKKKKAETKKSTDEPGRASAPTPQVTSAGVAKAVSDRQ